MRVVSTPYVDAGRTAQKRRTRQALVESARRLVAEGLAPTVEAAAQRAGISRTTAYRYFRNQAELLVAAHPETAAVSLLPPDPPGDPAARVYLVVSAFIRLVLDTEPQQRTMLRMSLEPATGGELPLRQGRAVGWIREALQPLAPALGDAAVEHLAVAIRSATGIEALAWLTDVARLEREDAADLMLWSAMAMVHAAVEGGRPPPERQASKSRVTFGVTGTDWQASTKPSSSSSSSSA
jgi:AcrR family transcriptional regulator